MCTKSPQCGRYGQLDSRECGLVDTLTHFLSKRNSKCACSARLRTPLSPFCALRGTSVGRDRGYRRSSGPRADNGWSARSDSRPTEVTCAATPTRSTVTSSPPRASHPHRPIHRAHPTLKHHLWQAVPSAPRSALQSFLAFSCMHRPVAAMCCCGGVATLTMHSRMATRTPTATSRTGRPSPRAGIF